MNPVLTTSDKKDGNMSFTYANDHKQVKHTIQAFLNAHNLHNKKRILMVPAHLNGVITLDKTFVQLLTKMKFDSETNDYKIFGDGIISNNPEFVYSLTPGDCAGIVLYSEKSEWFAFLHVGFINIITGLLPKVFAELKRLEPRAPFKALVGRHIHKKSYRHETPGMFNVAKEQGLKNYIEEKEDGYYFDLTKAISEELSKYDITITHIDTRDNFEEALQNRSFSHRAFKLGQIKEQGRVMSLLYFED